jgi:beta-1,3-galactosyltransferase 1
MSFDTAEKLYATSLSTPFFHLEDVYLTGFVAEKAKVKRLHHPLIFYLPSKDMCSMRGMLTQHHLTPMAIEMLYNFITNSSNVCSAPAKHFLLSKMKLTQRKRCQ